MNAIANDKEAAQGRKAVQFSNFVEYALGRENRLGSLQNKALAGGKKKQMLCHDRYRDWIELQLKRCKKLRRAHLLVRQIFWEVSGAGLALVRV